MSVKCTVKTTSEGKKFEQQLKELGDLKVKIGFQGSKAFEEDGVDVLDVAMWNELGTVGIPSRPFMRDAVDKHKDLIRAFLEKQAKAVANGQSSEVALKKIGVFIKGLVQEEIVSGSFEANAASTITKKGSATPLVDTGLMRQSVNYVIESKK